MPITAEAVRTKLQPPDMAQVRILASEIKHPILHPVELKADEALSPDGAAVLAVILNPSLRAARTSPSAGGGKSGTCPESRFSWLHDDQRFECCPGR